MGHDLMGFLDFYFDLVKLFDLHVSALFDLIFILVWFPKTNTTYQKLLIIPFCPQNFDNN